MDHWVLTCDQALIGWCSHQALDLVKRPLGRAGGLAFWALSMSFRDGCIPIFPAWHLIREGSGLRYWRFCLNLPLNTGSWQNHNNTSLAPLAPLIVTNKPCCEQSGKMGMRPFWLAPALVDNTNDIGLTPLAHQMWRVAPVMTRPKVKNGEKI